MVDPPTRDKIDEKWGTDMATNITKDISNVLHATRLNVKAENKQNILNFKIWYKFESGFIYDIFITNFFPANFSTFYYWKSENNFFLWDFVVYEMLHYRVQSKC